MKPQVLVIAGPTASGKKRIALEAALRFDGEIVSADSRKVYRLLDIGAAKPSPEDRARVPHHLIDIADPDEPFSAGRWAVLAADAVKDIAGRGKLPVISGGTGFYISALMDGLSEGIASDPAVRGRIERLHDTEGAEGVYRRLGAIDPERAGELHPNDTVRVIRALEIVEATGLTFREIKERGTERRADDWDVFSAGITREREILYKRINARVDNMLETGLEAEVRSILARGYSRTLAALDTVGYKEWWRYFDGAASYEDTVALIKRDTRRYAKRQLTWFRAQTGMRWCDPDIPGATDNIFEEIEAWRMVEKR